MYLDIGIKVRRYIYMCVCVRVYNYDMRMYHHEHERSLNPVERRAEGEGYPVAEDKFVSPKAW